MATRIWSDKYLSVTCFPSKIDKRRTIRLLDFIPMMLLAHVAIFVVASAADLPVTINIDNVDKTGQIVTLDYTILGEDVVLTCEATDAKKWAWFKDGRAIKKSNAYKVSGPNLTITDFVFKDAGRHSCKASDASQNEGTGYVDIKFTCRPNNVKVDCGVDTMSCTNGICACDDSDQVFIDAGGCGLCTNDLECGGTAYGVCNKTDPAKGEGVCLCTNGYIRGLDGLCGQCNAMNSCGTMGTCSANNHCKCNVGYVYNAKGMCAECAGNRTCSAKDEIGTCESDGKCVCKKGFIVGDDAKCIACKDKADCGDSDAVADCAPPASGGNDTVCTCKEGFPEKEDGRCGLKPTTVKITTEDKGSGTGTGLTGLTGLTGTTKGSDAGPVNGKKALSATVSVQLLSTTAALTAALRLL